MIDIRLYAWLTSPIINVHHHLDDWLHLGDGLTHFVPRSSIYVMFLYALRIRRLDIRNFSLLFPLVINAMVFLTLHIWTLKCIFILPKSKGRINIMVITMCINSHKCPLIHHSYLLQFSSKLSDTFAKKETSCHTLLQ